MDSIDDASDFQNVKNALKVMEINADEQDALFQLVAVVMHLGNVDFISDKNGHAVLKNPEVVATVTKVTSKHSLISVIKESGRNGV